MVRGDSSLEKDLGITAGPETSMGHGLGKDKGVRTGTLSLTSDLGCRLRPAAALCPAWHRTSRRKRINWKERKIEQQEDRRSKKHHIKRN